MAVRVCLAKADESHVNGLTDALGMVELDFLPLSTGEATLTVTGKNLAMDVQSLPVTAGSSYVSLFSMFVADNGTAGSVGNGNVMVESGEVIALTSVLKETGGCLTALMLKAPPARRKSQSF